MSDEKVLCFEKMMHCEKCWSVEGKALMFHVAAGCCCPMPICTSCLRKEKILCNGCNKPVRAVQLFDARRYEHYAKKFCKSIGDSSGETAQCIGCLKTKRVWAKHVTPTCMQDTKYCYNCAVGNLCNCCKMPMNGNNTTPFILNQ